MVRHWWFERERQPAWKRKLFLNGFGMLLTGGILVSLCVVKFSEGGWATMLVTGLLIASAFWIKRHYKQTQRQLQRLNELVTAATLAKPSASAMFPWRNAIPMRDRRLPRQRFQRTRPAHAAGGGPDVSQGLSEFCLPTGRRAGRRQFQGRAEVENLREHSRREVERYAAYMRGQGFYAEAHYGVGTDVADVAAELCEDVAKRFPQTQFFAGQLVFQDESILTRWLHNYTVFELQRRLYQHGWPMLILPIQV